MEQRKGKRIALLATIAGILVIGTFCYVARDTLLRSLSIRDEDAPLPISKEGLGTQGGKFLERKVSIFHGSAPLKEFATFLGYFTGNPVHVDPALQDQTVEILTDIREADAEVVRAILKANGYRVRVDPIEKGRHLLQIERRESRK